MFRLELKSQQQLTEQRRRLERQTQRDDERESNWESGSTWERESAQVLLASLGGLLLCVVVRTWELNRKLLRELLRIRGPLYHSSIICMWFVSCFISSQRRRQRQRMSQQTKARWRAADRQSERVFFFPFLKKIPPTAKVIHEFSGNLLLVINTNWLFGNQYSRNWLWISIWIWIWI